MPTCVRRAFELALARRGRLTSVDKANVLVVHELAAGYPDVAVEDMLVDNAAVQLASAPEQFDVIVTENMFGDILSDLAAAVTGGLGLAPSASVAADAVDQTLVQAPTVDIGGTATTAEFTDAVLGRVDGH